ncbi:acyltransferase family protein [Novosphingobium piscinae]|uniref:Acyltransferase n=1 Tax=Novosphingobium piscinae TaxID=1507448 RepID=A0A7X1G084_9SPHN|nr:acyltransferase [Novosphingobium piscinae]
MDRTSLFARGRRDALDSLRLIAISSVLIDHAGVFLHFFPGLVGVRFFLLLSGFLITRTLMAQLTGPIGESLPALLSFYAKRALRIWPLYYAIIAVLLAAGVIGLREAAVHGLFTTNIVQALRNHWHVPSWFLPHFWTICVQEQFYLVWPVLFVLIDGGRRTTLLAAMIAVAVLFRAGMWLTGLHTQVGFYTLPFASFDALAVGSLLALGHARLGALVQPRAQVAALVLAGLLAVAGLLGGFVDTVLLPGLWLLPLSVLILSAFDGRLGPAGTVLGWRPLVFFGRISLGIYLLHLPVAYAIITHGPRWLIPWVEHRTWSGLAINTGVTLVFATLSWFLFESPLQRLRRYLPDDRRARPAAAAAA